jgi:hypothetical protein
VDDEPTDVEPTTAEPATVPAERSRWRVAAAWLTSGLAALLVLVALALPDDFGHLSPLGFLTIPVEALVGVVAVLVLPARARRVAAVVAGALLGLVTLLKLLDLGFSGALARPFDPLSDWPLLASAREFVAESYGGFGAAVALVVVVLLAVAVPALTALAVLRLSRVVAERRAAAWRAAAVVGVGWVVLAVVGVQAVPGVPLAAWNTSKVTVTHLTQIPVGVQAGQLFHRQLAVDAYRDTPAGKLVNGLRGKDVVLVFVESFGRSAVEDPAIAPPVDALLDAGTQRLAADGFAARSAFLTSSTYGGGSWYAHSTLQSGLWINGQRDYNEFVASNRLTLTGAFHRAGWRTVAVMPANNRDWPEGAVYGYDQVYDSRTLGYKGRLFAFSSTPDQYTLSAFQRLERARPGHQPVMAEIDLLSSHIPWAPVPKLVDWAAVGDGSGYGDSTGVAPESSHDGNGSRVQADYARSVEYAMGSLVSYVETYGDDNLVLVLLGDHQPAQIVTGANASHDVPIAVVARDRAVLDRMSGWGWRDGLNPDPHAPVWRMDSFRDRFFAAFGS